MLAANLLANAPNAMRAIWIALASFWMTALQPAVPVLPKRRTPHPEKSAILIELRIFHSSIVSRLLVNFVDIDLGIGY